MKLGVKINLVLLLASVSIFFVGFLVIDNVESKSIKDEVINTTNTVAEIVHQNIERMFLQISSQEESLQLSINSLTKKIPGISYIEVADTKGVVIATTRPKDMPAGPDRLTIINNVLTTKKEFSEIKTEAGYYALEDHVPVFDNNNNVINIIEVEVNTKSETTQDVATGNQYLGIAAAGVEQATRSITLAIQGGSVYLQKIVDDASGFGKVNTTDEFGYFHDFVVLDTNLRILANTGATLDDFINDPSEYTQERRDVASGAKPSAKYERIHEGHDVIVDTEPIIVTDASGEHIVGVRESHILKAAYLNPINEFRLRLIGIGIVFTTTLVITLIVILEKQVVGPIRRYSVIAKKIADGDLNQKVEHLSNDEIGQFGDVFNSMVQNFRELDRLKSDFISVAAHQLRTPLSGVKWVLKLLLDGDLGPINEDQNGMLKRGYETNEKMIQLVNDLLNVSRIENGKFGYNFEKNDFLKLLNTLIENTVLPSRERSIHVELVNHAGVIPEFLFDPEKLLIALQNIVDNAMKYTLPGGKVTIVVERQGDYIEVKVSDTGVGIPKEDLPKLFSKFFRAANVIHLQTDGSGLGLFIVKSIIIRHGGQIWVDSVEGKGTTFTILVPVLAELLPKEEEAVAKLAQNIPVVGVNDSPQGNTPVA